MTHEEPAATPRRDVLGAEANLPRSSFVVRVRGEQLTVAEFLRSAAASLDAPESVVDADTARLVDAVLGGGLPALRVAMEEVSWLQYGLSIPTTSRAWLYRELAGAARRQLGEGLADEFFFVHKAPGLRIRFQGRSAVRAELDAAVRRVLDAWRDDGVIVDWRPAVYEPESHLFGGPRSMCSVHRIFTADSFAWLDFHGAQESIGPAWALSLLMIRGLFDAMAIVDWEDVDVWNRLREQLGRQLDPDLKADATTARTVLRQAWHDPARLWSQLNRVEARSIVDDYVAAVRRWCADWQADYFTAPRAYVGPREAASLLIAFHWNRANLSAPRQALITEALAVRDS